MKKLFALLLSAMIVFSLSACGGTYGDPSTNGETGAEPKEETVYLTCAATPSTAARYPFFVAVCQGISDQYPELNISISETQGTTDATQKINSGECDFGNGMCCSELWNYNGDVLYETSNPDARVLWYDDLTPLHFVVSKNSGITTLDGLTGQKYSSGGTGMTVATVTELIFEKLGVSPDYVESGKADASDAVCNRQIVGISATGSEPDSFIMQIGAAIDIDLISLDNATVDQIIAELPFLVKHTTPANTYDGVDHAVDTVALMQGCQSNASMSQETGYKIFKGMVEGKDAWSSTNASAAKQDTIALTLQSPIPLHAGTVQYLVENGYDVPENLIPAEYVAVN